MGKGKRRGLGLGSIIIIMVCLIVFVGCGAYLGNYYLGNLGDSKELTAIKHGLPEKNLLLTLHVRNEDIFGWVDVEDTHIDYPVMSVTQEDDEFYLHRNFDKEYSESGTPFKDASSDIESSNWFIYGHNMKTGTMFHDLLKFDSEEFWKDHQYITFNHLEEDEVTGELVEIHQQCQIVAAGYSRIYDYGSDAFKYYEYTSIGDEEEFDEFVRGIKKQSAIDTGVDAEYGDQLVTLSTCAYHTTDGRFYVVGKLVDNIKR